MSVQAAGWPSGLSLTQVLENYHGPLHAVVLAMVAHAAGWTERALRAPSVALAALSPFAVWYAQECRNYAFVMLFATLCLWAAWRLVAEEGAARGPVRGRWWALLAGSGTLAMWSNLDAAFLLAGVILASLVLRPAVLRERAAWGTVTFWVLCLAPWVPAVFGWLDVGRLTGAVETPPLRGETTLPAMAVPYAFYAYCTGYSLGPSLRDLHVSTSLATLRPWFWAIVPAGVAFGVPALVGTGALLGRRGRLAFVALAMAVPLACVIFLASRNLKVFNPRYAAVIVPLVWVVIAAGVARLPRGLAWLCGGAIVAASVLSLAHLAFDLRYARDDFRGVSALLRAEARAGDEAVVEVYHLPLDFYGTGAARKTVLWEEVDRDAARTQAALTPVLGRATRVWRIYPPYAFDDPAHAVVPALARWGRRTRTADFAGLTVELWERPAR